jgi:hypothetical protein
MREERPYLKGCWQDSTSGDASARQGWIYGRDSVRLRATTRMQSAGYLVLVINAGLRQERWCRYSFLQSALAARGSQDARNPGPRLQSVKDAQFDFDYSTPGPWERHPARSVIRLVI